MIRKAIEHDLARVTEIYGKIHAEEREGRYTIGWNPNIYPVYTTAADALNRGDLFIYESEGGEILASAIINKEQLDSYGVAKWTSGVKDDEVMVLHTLTVDPSAGGQGIGRAFVKFYEDYARENGCHSLRLDTQSINTVARRFYPKLGYKEVAVVPTTFHGIRNIDLVLFEKII
ncbi:MAG: GNAT family N-acetyltransferase [Duncaniella sp.]|uniref:GNAT family N-acetyltransferase n=1 Tax=Duncaniella sp. TaxID=2518496 RepID=UPI0023CC3B2B|nr:GNAT family N-acetyltransferase [Duncaniella sp.]MDE6090694.1 GNAT family N-acetyltransferase [Duncaniella sp.]